MCLMVPEEIAALPPFPGFQSSSPGEREREYPLQGNVPLSFVGIFWREIGLDFGGKREFRGVQETAGFLGSGYWVYPGSS